MQTAVQRSKTTHFPAIAAQRRRQQTIQSDPVMVCLTGRFAEHTNYDVDFADVRGQEMAKRAVTIAAAGSHNILTLGSV